MFLLYGLHYNQSSFMEYFALNTLEISIGVYKIRANTQSPFISLSL